MRVICVNGIIGAGKTTFADAYEKWLVKNGHTVLTVLEPVQYWINTGMLDLFYKDPKRWGYTFQTMVFESRVNTINNDYRNYIIMHAGKEPDFILLDRSPATDELFMQILHEDGNVSEVEMNLYGKWKDMWVQTLSVHPDINVHINPGVETCMSRLRSRGREEECSVTEDYQQKLYEKHINLFEKLDENVVNVGATYDIAEVHNRLMRAMG
jgi:deoxyadenosine/deoxycytidine kinase